LLFPLIVSPTELAVPAFGGFELSHFAQIFGLVADVFFGEQDLLIDFCVES